MATVYLAYVFMRWKILRAPMMAVTMVLSPGSVSTISAAPRAASVAPATEGEEIQQEIPYTVAVSAGEAEHTHLSYCEDLDSMLTLNLQSIIMQNTQEKFLLRAKFHTA